MLKKFIAVLTALLLVLISANAVYATNEITEEESAENIVDSFETAEEPEAIPEPEIPPQTEEIPEVDTMEHEELEPAEEESPTTPEETLEPEEVFEPVEVIEEPEEVEEPITSEPIEGEEEDVEDVESPYDQAIAHIITRRCDYDEDYIDLRAYRIKSSDQEDFAGWLSLYYGEFYIECKNGYVVAVIFPEPNKLYCDNPLDEDDEEDISYIGSNIIEEAVAEVEKETPQEIIASKAEVRGAYSSEAEEPMSLFMQFIMLLIFLGKRMINIL